MADAVLQIRVMDQDQYAEAQQSLITTDGNEIQEMRFLIPIPVDRFQNNAGIYAVGEVPAGTIDAMNDYASDMDPEQRREFFFNWYLENHESILVQLQGSIDVEQAFEAYSGTAQDIQQLTADLVPMGTQRVRNVASTEPRSFVSGATVPVRTQRTGQTREQASEERTVDHDLNAIPTRQRESRAELEPQVAEAPERHARVTDIQVQETQERDTQQEFLDSIADIGTAGAEQRTGRVATALPRNLRPRRERENQGTGSRNSPFIIHVPVPTSREEPGETLFERDQRFIFPLRRGEASAYFRFSFESTEPSQEFDSIHHSLLLNPLTRVMGSQIRESYRGEGARYSGPAIENLVQSILDDARSENSEIGTYLQE